MLTLFKFNDTEWCAFGPANGKFELYVRNPAGRWALFAGSFKTIEAAMRRAERASLAFAA